ncbi:hypothetical protein J6590_033662 [Homalodisca vitripennis]|nr:hypothetical protein J6590_033662 [Homalodisca vitripennis]
MKKNTVFFSAVAVFCSVLSAATSASSKRNSEIRHQLTIFNASLVQAADRWHIEPPAVKR